MIRRFFTSREGTTTAEKAVRPGTRRSRRSRPALESLEGRQLLSLGPEMISPVNTTTRNNQFDADNASSVNGSSVVVWTDQFSVTDHDIRAQLFNAAGAKVGPEIVVSFSSLDENSPAVAMDSHGNFVVSWTQIQPGGDTNVVAQRFSSAGSRQGALIPVGAGTFREHDSDVAMSAGARSPSRTFATPTTTTRTSSPSSTTPSATCSTWSTWPPPAGPRHPPASR